MSAAQGVTADWVVGIVAETVEGDVVLRMTEEQAESLRDSLIWLTEDDDNEATP